MGELEMNFHPGILRHLGIELYSQLPFVLGELVANAYDADAKEVRITLKNNGEQRNKEIIIKDDGEGMLFDEINSQFLMIGKNRRERDGNDKTPQGRKIIGKKGIGKLSFFGIAKEARISTVKNKKKNVFNISHEKISRLEEGVYKPEIVTENESCNEPSGTEIVLTEIKRLTNFKADSLADSLSKMFIVDSDFKISVICDGGKPELVSRDRRYQKLKKSAQWEIPEDPKVEESYWKANKICGRLIAAEKPLDKKQRGIVLLSRKKLVSAPENFPVGSSSHFFSYLTGHLEIDFIEEFDEDVISTDRKSLAWDSREMEKLKEHLKKLLSRLERDWKKKGKEERKNLFNVDTVSWREKLPDDVHEPFDAIVGVLEDSTLPPEESKKAIKGLGKILPEYPKYHWRHLHEKVRDASERDYKNCDYHRALEEALKSYIEAVRQKSGSKNDSVQSMMGKVFGEEQPDGKGKKLKVVENFCGEDASPLSDQTIGNIEEAQKFLSKGIVCGYRNPIAHDEIRYLKSSGLLTEADCLDGLSLLSHLFSRLEGGAQGN